MVSSCQEPFKTIYNGLVKDRFEMVEKYTVSELAEKLGVSTTAVYKKVDKKQLETVKEKVGSRELTYIILNKLDLERLIEETSLNKEANRVGYKQFNEQPETEIKKPITVENQSQYLELTKQVIQLTQNLSNQFENYSKQMVEYAEKAGQVYLLTDNLNQEKLEAENYKNEYFKLKYENEGLTIRYNELLLQIENLKEQQAGKEKEIKELKEKAEKFDLTERVKEVYREEQQKKENSGRFFERFSFKKKK